MNDFYTNFRFQPLNPFKLAIRISVMFFLMFRKRQAEARLARLATSRASLAERRDDTLAREMEGVERRKRIVMKIKEGGPVP